MLQNPTLNELFDAYLKVKRDPNALPRCKTAASIAAHLKVVAALWGTMAVEDFRSGSRQRVRDQISAWVAAGYSPHTIRTRLAKLRTVFRFAVEEELITREQEPVFRLPPPGPPRQRFIHPVHELPKILRELYSVRTPHHTALFWQISMRTGQRSNAIKALRWSQHIDFEQRLILFRETEEPGERTKKRRTNQPMDASLYAILMAAKERAEGDHVIEWAGKPVDNIYNSVKAMYRRAGVSGVHIHDIRRTVATLLNSENGGDKKAVADLLGDTVEMAAQTYIVDDPPTRLKSIESAGAIIDRARAPVMIDAAKSPEQQHDPARELPGGWWDRISAAAPSGADALV